jgi:hypothetical protein
VDLEESGSEATQARPDARRPSPELQGRIVETVSTQRPRTVKVRWRPRLAAIAAILLIAVLAAIGLHLRSDGQPVTGGPTGTPAGGSVSGTPPAVPAGNLAHFDRDGLVFDYPADWQASVSGLNEHYITILDFLGTGSGLATCTALTPGPSDQFLSGTQCGTDIRVDPGQVMVELSRSDGPGGLGPIDPADPSGIAYGGKYVTVGGLPAIYSEDTSNAIIALDWILSVPTELISRYRIHAHIKGPGVERMRAQVEALVASIAYDPPVPVLNPADASRIAAVGLEQARAYDAAYACFQAFPGATATATIAQFPGYSPLRKPLPVTCSMEIEPNLVGLWKMSLTWSWTAASDRSAGSLTATMWLSADGTLGGTGYGPEPSEIPYWP